MIPSTSHRRILLPLLVALALSAGTTAATAEVFRIGPAGDYSSLQDALDTASSRPGSHHFRVQRGRYFESVEIRGFAPDISWRITGGFGPTFSTSTRSRDAASTIFDGQNRRRVLNVSRGDGIVLIEDLTVASGFVDVDDPFRGSRGAGALLRLAGTARTILRNVTVRDSRVLEDIDSVSGGGVAAILRDQARLEIERSLFKANVAESIGNSDASGAGLDAALFDRSRLDLEGTRFEGNEARVIDNQATAAAASIVLRGGASATIREVEAISNRLVTGTGGSASTTAMIISTRWTERGSVLLDRSRFLRNEATGSLPEFSPAVDLIGDGPGRILARNTVIAENVGRGLGADARGENTSVRLLNLTIAGNRTGGLATPEHIGPIHLANSIVFDNGLDLDVAPGTVIDASNLIATDPLFEDTIDFDLAFGSPAINAGRSDLPIGPFDVDRDDRLFGSAVDVGAQEAKPTVPPATPCRVSGLTFPVEPVCLCFRQSGFQEFRCGVQIPGVFLDFGFDLSVPDQLPTRLALLPRTDLESLRFDADGFQDKFDGLAQWQSLTTKGSVVPSKDSAVSKVLFAFELHQPGANEADAFKIEIALPEN